MAIGTQEYREIYEGEKRNNVWDDVITDAFNPVQDIIRRRDRWKKGQKDASVTLE